MGLAAFNAMRRRAAAEKEAAEQATNDALAAKETKKQELLEVLSKWSKAELNAKAVELGIIFPKSIDTNPEKAAYLSEVLADAAESDTEADAENDIDDGVDDDTEGDAE